MADTSPDVTGYVDLTIHDVDVQGLIDAALADATGKLPAWVPREGHTEVVAIEAMATVVAEMVYAINRLPGAVTEALLGLYGLTRDAGTPPAGTATFALSDTLGHTIPAGTRLRIDVAGADPVDVTTDRDLVVAAGTSSGTVEWTGVDNTSRANTVTVGTALTLIDAVPYVNTVTLASLTAGVDPEGAAGFLDRGAARLARLVETLVLPEHFTARAVEDPAVARATTLDNYAPDVNLLGVDTATIEGGTGTWAAFANVTLARSTAAAAEGSASLALTAAAAGDMVAATARGTAGVPVTAGVVYTVRAAFRPASTARNARVYLTWFDAAGAALTDSVPGWTAEVAGAWEVAPVTATAPAGAATVSVQGQVQGAAAGEVHHLDAVDLHTGTRTTFQHPDVNAPGEMPGHVTVAVVGDGGAPVAQATKDALDTAMEDAAQANLAVHVIDATVTAVAVSVTVVRLAGWTDSQVVANVTAALQGYLDPDVWPWAATVWRNELIAVVDGAAGVDRVVTIDAPTADVTLAGVAPLATAGTITVTVQAPA